MGNQFIQEKIYRVPFKKKKSTIAFYDCICTSMKNLLR